MREPTQTPTPQELLEKRVDTLWQEIYGAQGNNGMRRAHRECRAKREKAEADMRKTTTELKVGQAKHSVLVGFVSGTISAGIALGVAILIKLAI